MKRFLIFSLLLSLSTSLMAQKEVADHQVWDQLLTKYVSAEGKVDYKGIKADPAFGRYLGVIQNTKVADSWTKEQKMAFWINAYNAFTIKLITDNLPIESITKLDKPWDKPFVKIGSSTLSLNDIEHKKLREPFKDPRIHFAVNCASFSCPVLLNKAFTAANLEVELEKLARRFVNDPLRNKLSGDSAQISKIFEWYADDFGGANNLITYLNKYAAKPISKNARITYMDYNWNLNSK